MSNSKPFKEILVIDDDNIHNFVISKYIKKAKLCEMLHVQPNGSAALNYLETCLNQREPIPDLIIVDIKMPVMNGFEFLKIYENKYWKQFPATRVVILTSSIRSDDKKEAMKFKCVSDFFIKPITIDQLKNIQPVNTTV